MLSARQKEPIWQKLVLDFELSVVLSWFLFGQSISNTNRNLISMFELEHHFQLGTAM